MTTKKRIRLFWAWEDEKEAAWLNKMSQQGWHFQSVHGLCNYTFERGEPTDFAYQLDFVDSEKDMDNYLQMFEDAGWDYLGKMGRWQYFRQEARGGAQPRIYTDNASKVAMYQRVLLPLVVGVVVMVLSLYTLGDRAEGFYQFLAVLNIGFLLLLIYGIGKMIGRINTLKKTL